jgi:glycosyltransferase involved in cell wall biosynthesis
VLKDREMNAPRVSIITPIYNGEQFIKKCYDCVKQQTYSNIEWVVINDGSQDNTLCELESVYEDFSNLIIIDQVNSGAAEARRAGAAQANGDYIVYLDIDDAIGSNAIELAMQKFDENTDLVLFTQIKVGGDVVQPFVMFTDSWPQQGRDVFRSCIDGWGAHSFGIYRKTVFLNSYKFLDRFDGMSDTYKDELLSRIIFTQSRSIEYCQGQYLYDLNDASVSKKYNPEYFKIANNVHALQSYLISQKMNICIERMYSRLFFDLLGRYIKWRKQLTNKSEWQRALNKLVKHISLINDAENCIKKNAYKKILPRIFILLAFKTSAIFRNG